MKKITGKIPKNTNNPFKTYEEKKKDIEKKNLSAKEYERMVRSLSRRMGI